MIRNPEPTKQQFTVTTTMAARSAATHKERDGKNTQIMEEASYLPCLSTSILFCCAMRVLWPQFYFYFPNYSIAVSHAGFDPTALAILPFEKDNSQILGLGKRDMDLFRMERVRCCLLRTQKLSYKTSLMMIIIIYDCYFISRLRPSRSTLKVAISTDFFESKIDRRVTSLRKKKSFDKHLRMALSFVSL